MHVEETSSEHSGLGRLESDTQDFLGAAVPSHLINKLIMVLFYYFEVEEWPPETIRPIEHYHGPLAPILDLIRNPIQLAPTPEGLGSCSAEDFLRLRRRCKLTTV